MAQASTRTVGGARDLILDSAEELFAQNGFDGVPVREIAKHAGLNLSLVTYHFPSKESLFDEVLGRRAVEINTMRSALLNEFRLNHSNDHRGLLEAYMMPFLLKIGSGDIKWRNYGELISQLSHAPKYAWLIKKYYNEIAREYAVELSQTFGRDDLEASIRALVFSISVLMGAMAAVRRVESLSEKAYSSADFRTIYPSMLEYICCGVEGMMLGSAKAMKEAAVAKKRGAR